jgi:hypothetical protein
VRRAVLIPPDGLPITAILPAPRREPTRCRWMWRRETSDTGDGAICPMAGYSVPHGRAGAPNRPLSGAVPTVEGATAAPLVSPLGGHQARSCLATPPTWAYVGTGRARCRTPEAIRVHRACQDIGERDGVWHGRYEPLHASRPPAGRYRSEGPQMAWARLVASTVTSARAPTLGTTSRSTAAVSVPPTAASGLCSTRDTVGSSGTGIGPSVARPSRCSASRPMVTRTIQASLRL